MSDESQAPNPGDGLLPVGLTPEQERFLKFLEQAAPAGKPTTLKVVGGEAAPGEPPTMNRTDALVYVQHLVATFLEEQCEGWKKMAHAAEEKRDRKDAQTCLGVASGLAATLRDANRTLLARRAPLQVLEKVPDRASGKVPDEIPVPGTRPPGGGGQ